MIVVKLQGGLGNQMFQYALGRELQRRQGGDLYLDLTWLLDRYPRADVTYRDYQLDIFGIKPRFTLLSEIARRRSVPLVLMYGSLYLSRFLDRFGVRRYVKEGLPGVSPELLRQLKGDVYLDGYWQSPGYFEDSGSVLRQEFKVRAPLLPSSLTVAAMMDETDSICLNVRRTDYVTNRQTFQTHGFLGRGYYDRGVSLLAPKLRNPHIFITSDDDAWCRENLRFDYPTTILGEEHHGYKFGNKFALMCRCKHFIIPNSSFAWWAAWLGAAPEKTVICPQEWFRDPSFDTSKLTPSEWIRL